MNQVQFEIVKQAIFVLAQAIEDGRIEGITKEMYQIFSDYKPN